MPAFIRRRVSKASKPFFVEMNSHRVAECAGTLAVQDADTRRFEGVRLEPEQVLKDAFFVALEGETFIGMSSLWRYGARLETDFTGVLPAYRGRGIAALMKLKGVRYAQEHRFAELRTANDAVNVPMRRLNERLGFVAQPARLRLEKQLGIVR